MRKLAIIKSLVVIFCSFFADSVIAQKGNSRIIKIYVEKLPYSLHVGIGVSNDNFDLLYRDDGSRLCITDASDIQMFSNSLKHAKSLSKDLVSFNAKLYIKYENLKVDTLYLGTVGQFNLNNGRGMFKDDNVMFLVWPEMRPFYEK